MQNARPLFTFSIKRRIRKIFVTYGGNKEQWKLGVKRKSLKSQWIGKITTQQTKTSKVNTVSCILLNILASIYRFEPFT